MPADIAPYLADVKSQGSQVVRWAEMVRRFADLGYRLTIWGPGHLTPSAGPCRGQQIPTLMTVITEADTGMCSSHHMARRDDRFQAMQRLRFGAVIAIRAGRAVSP
jgi:hypothetical protein